MLLYIVALLCLFALYVVYRYYLVPKRITDHYARVFKEKGYKVYHYPFKFLGVPHLEQALRNIDTKKDGTYDFKHTLVGYDVIVANFLADPFIGFINPELGKELTTL